MEIMEKRIRMAQPSDYNAAGETAMLSLNDFAEFVKNSQKLKEVTDELRELAQTAEEQIVNRAKQRCMPIAQFHSVCKPTRCTENVVCTTGLLCLDIDDYDGDYGELAKRMWADKVLNPCLVFRSPRGKLKVVLQTTVVNKENFFETYGSAMLWVFENYGVACDSSCNDIVRNTFAAHDEQCLCDPQRFTSDDVFVCWNQDEYTKVFGTAKKDYSEKDLADIQKRTLDIIKTLEVDENGYPVYDHATRLFIGRRGNGTKAVNVCGLEGNELKYRINACAMALFGQNPDAAQRFVNTCFVDHNDVWGKVNGHKDYMVHRSVLRWLVRNCGFRKKLQYK